MQKKVLFICLGNICRSPAAEAIMKKMVQDAGLVHQIYCESAGTSGYHQGAPPDARMKEHAAKRGYRLMGKSRPLEASDFELFDYLVVMDRQNLKDVEIFDRNKKFSKKIFTMTHFCENMEALEVPDPYYQGTEGFERVLDILEDACRGFLQKIKES